MRAPIGLRIRNQRKLKGLTQAALAKSADISASYLNLIEANKREVGGVLLHKLAAALEIELEKLTGDAEQRLLTELQEAFADPALDSLALTPNDAHTLVAQQPQIAQALHQLYRAYLGQRDQADALTHRLQSDPIMSELLHQMLSQITAVRSTAEILRDMPTLETDAQANFHTIIANEAHGLSQAARSLISEFQIETEKHRALNPAREVDDFLIEKNNHFPKLEIAATRIRNRVAAQAKHLETRHLVADLETTCSASVRYEGPPRSDDDNAHRDFGFDELSQTLWFRHGVPMATQRFRLARQIALFCEPKLLDELTEHPLLKSEQSKQLAMKALASYLASAILLPYDDFLAAAEDCKYDIDFLAQKYVASFEQIAHRFVTLRAPGAAGIPFGFIRSDPSGFLTKQFPLTGLLLPNSGHACPLWPLSTAYRAPNTTVHRLVQFSDGSRYLFLAKASAHRISAFDDIPAFSSVMLACNILDASETVYGANLNLSAPETDIPVGPACRLCVRTNCAHRQESVAQNVFGASGAAT